MNRWNRNYFYQISKDGKSVIIGTTWDFEIGKMNQLGIITKRDDSNIYLDFEFKLPNGILVKKEKAGVDEILEAVCDYFSKDDLINLCGFLFCWK